MSIIGLGTDIAEVARFDHGRLSMRFLQSVFTDSERAYCEQRQRSHQHLAVRFAAKEAAAKALSSAVSFVSICQIEVFHDEARVPRIRLITGRHGESPPLLPACSQLHVSLSHSDLYAVATVILEVPELK